MPAGGSGELMVPLSLVTRACGGAALLRWGDRLTSVVLSDVGADGGGLPGRLGGCVRRTATFEALYIQVSPIPGKPVLGYCFKGIGIL